jgi:hypothetical protein
MGTASPQKMLRGVFALLLTLAMLTGAAHAETRSDIAARSAPDLQTEAGRQRFIITRQAERPFPKPDHGSPETQALGHLNLALALLWLGGDDDVRRANDLLLGFLDGARSAPWYKGVTARHRAGTPADNDYFHFQPAQYLFRMVHMPGGAARLSNENRDKIQAVMADWAGTECRIGEARADVWTIWGSENHAALRDGSCWAASVLLTEDPPAEDVRYADGSRPEEQLEAWTAHLKRWLRSRGRAGALVEYFSPTYAQYTLLNILLYADFSKDEELRGLASDYLDLWWAQWAQEQLDGVHGGSKTRSYAKSVPDGTPMPVTAWLYFGLGERPTRLPPGEAPMAVSSYRPPALVAALARASGARGVYDVVTRAPGLPRSPMEPGPVYHMDEARNGVLRVTRVAPGFAMGLGMVPLLREEDWTAISSQTRWAGLVFSGGDPRARIVPSVLLPRGRKSYNALFGVQNGATQIVRGIFKEGARNAPRMGVWIGKPLRRLEQGEWIFTEHGSYAAVRPAFGGWQPDPAAPGWMVLNDPSSPVILQAATKEDYPDLSSFISAATAMKMERTETELSVEGLGDAGRLTLGLGESGTLMINGEPVNLDPTFVMRSPFINQAAGSGAVEMRYGGKALNLDFGPP